MNLLNLLVRLHARFFETPDSPVKPGKVSDSALPQLACTPDTPDTPKDGGRASPSATLGVASSAGNDSVVPVPMAAPDSFGDRVALFVAHQVELEEAKLLAGRLAQRDRVIDDRRLCLECDHLSGASEARRCSNWRVTRMRGPAIPGELIDLLQRCAGFTERTGPVRSVSAPVDDDSVDDAAAIKGHGDE